MTSGSGAVQVAGGLQCLILSICPRLSPLVMSIIACCFIELGDGETTRDETTPLVFANDELIGWGEMA
ncbi:MAG: DUF3192 domain-containing protein [Wenzhouxiangellaceae bacterium]